MISLLFFFLNSKFVVLDRTHIWAVHTVGIMIIELLLIFGSLQNVNLDDPKKKEKRISSSDLYNFVSEYFWAGATVPSIRKRGFLRNG